MNNLLAIIQLWEIDLRAYADDRLSEIMQKIPNKPHALLKRSGAVRGSISSVPVTYGKPGVVPLEELLDVL